MKIAWFTPFCESSAIGRYSAVILDELTETHEVVVFATGLGRRAGGHRPALQTKRIDGRGGSAVLRLALAKFDVVVYNIGNFGPFHADIFRTQVEHPGVVILHDFATWGLFASCYLDKRPKPAGWLAELEYSHGREAREWGVRFLAGRASLSGTQERSVGLNLARSCVRGALGVVVHGEWVRESLAALAAAPVARIDFPAFLDPRGSAPVGVSPSDKVRLLTFGHVNTNKAFDVVIDAIAASKTLRERVEYTIAGSMAHAPYVKELHEQVRRSGLEGVVRFIDRPDDAALQRLVAEADVLVNLRYPHLGECSGSLQEALFHGKPSVVWAHGYYDEFPDDIVCKVRSLPELIASLERLVASPEERRARGRRAAAHATHRFDTGRYCRELVAFLETCVRGRPACQLIDRLSERLSEFYGDQAPEEIVGRLAEEVALMSRPRPASLPDAKAA